MAIPLDRSILSIRFCVGNFTLLDLSQFVFNVRWYL